MNYELFAWGSKVCYWCGGEVVYFKEHQVVMPQWAATKDHILPRTKRQKGEKVPIVVACYRCNNLRAARTDWVPFHLGGRSWLPFEGKNTRKDVLRTPHPVSGTPNRRKITQIIRRERAVIRRKLRELDSGLSWQDDPEIKKALEQVIHETPG